MSAAGYGMSGRRRMRLGERWYARWAFKWLIFAGVTGLTLFPYPTQTWRHVQHILNLESMVEPNAPELARWDDDMATLRATAKQQAGPGLESEPHAMQRLVERFVLDHVKYDWDWNLWGSADYMPTVAEMFRQGDTAADKQIREDCDGRAVMAASLMRRLGFDSHIVTDLRHVWVTTKQGEWMGPGRAKTIQSTAKGNETSILATAANLPVALSYGVAVFPFWRELVIAATAFVLLWHRRSGWRTGLIGGVLLVQGLLFMRLGFVAPQRVAREVSEWPSWIGVLHVACGLIVLMSAARVARLKMRSGPRL